MRVFAHLGLAVKKTLAGQQQILVARHDALGIGRRARGVDDRGKVGRSDAADRLLKFARILPAPPRTELLELLKGQIHRVFEHEQGPGIDDHEPRDIRQPVQDRQQLVEVLLGFQDDDVRAAVGHDELDFGGRAGGIDAHGDRAGRHDGVVRDYPFDAGIAHDDDTIAGFDAQLHQAKRGLLDLSGELGPCVALVDTQVLFAERHLVRSCAHAFEQEARHALSGPFVQAGAQSSQGFVVVSHGPRRPARLRSSDPRPGGIIAPKGTAVRASRGTPPELRGRRDGRNPPFPAQRNAQGSALPSAASR